MRVRQGRRAVWLCVFFLFLLGALGGRLYQLQIVKGELYARTAHKQRTLSLPTASRRGNIFDRNGVALTDPRPSWSVAVFPPLLQDAGAAARTLAPLLGLPQAEVEARLHDAEKRPVWIARYVSSTVAARVREMALPGIVSAPGGLRYGPGSLARHLVGYVNEQGGQLGLERGLDREIAGDAVPALVAYLDGTGTPLAGLGVRAVLPLEGKQPYHVYTTIDSRLQREVERILDGRKMPDGSPLRAAVAVMDVRTGDVLALASRPDYDQVKDPGSRPDRGGEAFLLNRAVSGFEPGSVFKAVVAAAALDGGQVSLDERFFCPGHYDVGGQRIFDNGGVTHGWITFREALAKSCNIVFAKVGYERLGREHLLEAARRFGFGSPALVGLPEEQAGTLPALQYGGEVAQFSFGQGGLLVTPLQVARAFAGIAADGLMPAPRLVTVIKNPAGRVMSRPAAGKPVQVMSAAAARDLRKALVAVTDPRGSGTGKQAWVEDGGSAGKTGSAEGVEQGRTTIHAWFAGYVPADSPRWSIAVMVQGGGLGGEVAAPIFREVGRALTAMY